MDPMLLAPIGLLAAAFSAAGWDWFCDTRRKHRRQMDALSAASGRASWHGGSRQQGPGPLTGSVGATRHQPPVSGGPAPSKGDET